MNISALTHIAAVLLLSPLALGLINRVKAKVAGRKGVPLLQTYYDIRKLMKKGAVISKTTGWVFAAGPSVNLAAILFAACFVPLGGAPSLISFSGDIFLFAYILGLGRFFTVIAALDTGSSFEGMGASREMEFSALAEVSFIAALVALAVLTGNYSVSSIYNSISLGIWTAGGPLLILVMAAMFVVLLAENCRIPVDDPNTHLELTMIHEVMVLDHGGPDLAYITYASSLKLTIFAILLSRVAIPAAEMNPWIVDALCLAGVAFVIMLVGFVESFMARLKLVRVPQLLCVAVALSMLALFLALYMR